MSPAEPVERATQWLQDLVQELSGLRNATSRDPGFKNWRQNALTALQRIWPADQDHAERFRRIPFSPVDPRADTRAQRESFSRGCQEAARVLTSFIEEIHALGVPDAPSDQQQTEESGFEDGFPTVDLPGGDLGVADGMSAFDDAEIEQLPPQGADPSFVPPPRLHIDTPPSGTALPTHHSTPPSETRPNRKGLGVAAKLRDLLGLGGFASKPSQPSPQPPPPPSSGVSSALPHLPPRSLDIVPVGDEVDTRPRSRSWPVPQPKTQAPGAPPAAAPPKAAPTPAAQAPEPPPVAGSPPPAEPGMSVVMSRPTTLRANIGKVSIESIFSPEFRSGSESNAATPPAGEPAAATPPASAEKAPPAAAAPPAPEAKAGKSGAQKRVVRPPSNATPAPRAAQPAQPGARPPLSIVPPLSSDPEFNVDPVPDASEPEAEPPVAARPNAASKVVALPLPPGAAGRGASSPPQADEPAEAAADEAPAEEAPRSHSAELARATADFLRTSPVLGATGRKVQHALHESPEQGFSDPDAIAVVSMVDELTLMGVPTTRQSETRARLLDLARRMEANDLQWSALRKAVWFAMEYPEVARRLMPMLLPWIDRAA